MTYPTSNEMRDTLLSVVASLAAAVSLLERGGKAAKKAAPSDKMFDQMLTDYRKSLAEARKVLIKPPSAPETKTRRTDWLKVSADEEFEKALQDSGVPQEPLSVYDSNSWRRVGLKREYREVMAPCLSRHDGHVDIRGTAVLRALVAAFNAMLFRRRSSEETSAPLTPAEMGTVARMAAVSAQVQPEKASDNCPTGDYPCEPAKQTTTTGTPAGHCIYCGRTVNGKGDGHD